MTCLSASWQGQDGYLIWTESAELQTRDAFLGARMAQAHGSIPSSFNNSAWTDNINKRWVEEYSLTYIPLLLHFLMLEL